MNIIGLSIIITDVQYPILSIHGDEKLKLHLLCSCLNVIQKETNDSIDNFVANHLT